MVERPDTPFRPSRFVVYPVGKAGTTKRGGKLVKCWDVRGQADGRQWFRRFTAPEETAAMAKRFAQQVVKDYEAGLLWDTRGRRFVEPAHTRPVSVYDWLVIYWKLQVESWEPATRTWAARSLTRAAVGLLKPGAPGVPAEILEHLRGTFTPRPSAPSPVAVAWLETWSTPLASVSHNDLDGLLTAHRTKSNGQPVAPTTEKRFAAELQACWRAALGRALIVTNPWDAVKVGRKVRHQGKVTNATFGVQPVDTDLVLSPAQVWALADAVSSIRPSAGRYRAFVAMMGLCGPRPSEATAIWISDLELPPPTTPDATGVLTIRRTRRLVAARWITDDEDPKYGPLKGRDSFNSRRVPIPSSLVVVLREHIANYRANAAPDDLLFVAAEGGPIDLSRFGRDYWGPARKKHFAGDPSLLRIRRHDLRHAACSMWLQAGVPLKQCTKWSGHQSVKVFLDEYQGLLPGSEEEGVARLEAWLKNH